MGSDSSKVRGAQYKKRFESEVQYELISKRYDSDVFNCDIQLYSERETRHQVACLEKLNQNDHFSPDRLAELEQRLNYPHPNLIKLLGYFSDTETSSVCGSTFQQCYFVEYPIGTLRNEIHLRKYFNQPYTELEIWAVMHSVVSGLLELRKSNKFCRNVSSSTIFIDYVGNYQISEMNLTKDSSLFNEITLKIFADDIYLSPAQVEIIRDEQLVDTSNPFLSDIFSLGVLLTELIYLEDQSDLFKYSGDYEAIEVNVTGLKQRLLYRENTLSRNLIRLILFMVEEAEKDRISLDELAEELTKNYTNSLISEANLTGTQAQIHIANSSKSTFLQQLLNREEHAKEQMKQGNGINNTNESETFLRRKEHANKAKKYKTRVQITDDDEDSTNHQPKVSIQEIRRDEEYGGAHHSVKSKHVNQNDDDQEEEDYYYNGKGINNNNPSLQLVAAASAAATAADEGKHGNQHSNSPIQRGVHFSSFAPKESSEDQELPVKHHQHTRTPSIPLTSIVPQKQLTDTPTDTPMSFAAGGATPSQQLAQLQIQRTQLINRGRDLYTNPLLSQNLNIEMEQITQSLNDNQNMQNTLQRIIGSQSTQVNNNNNNNTQHHQPSTRFRYVSSTIGTPMNQTNVQRQEHQFQHNQQKNHLVESYIEFTEESPMQESQNPFFQESHQLQQHQQQQYAAPPPLKLFRMAESRNGQTPMSAVSVIQPQHHKLPAPSGFAEMQQRQIEQEQQLAFQQQQQQQQQQRTLLLPPSRDVQHIQQQQQQQVVDRYDQRINKNNVSTNRYATIAALCAQPSNENVPKNKQRQIMSPLQSTPSSIPHKSQQVTSPQSNQFRSRQQSQSILDILQQGRKGADEQYSQSQLQQQSNPALLSPNMRVFSPKQQLGQLTANKNTISVRDMKEMKIQSPFEAVMSPKEASGVGSTLNKNRKMLTQGHPKYFS